MKKGRGSYFKKNEIYTHQYEKKALIRKEKGHMSK